MHPVKQSVKHHEQGRRHKEMVEETFKQKRKAKADAMTSDRELQDQLREIEEVRGRYHTFAYTHPTLPLKRCHSAC